MQLLICIFSRLSSLEGSVSGPDKLDKNVTRRDLNYFKV